MSDTANLYTERPLTIVMYSTAWCPDCRRARQVLTDERTAFLDVDIDKDTQAAQFVQKLNRGYRSVPTIVFPDGTRMVEPSSDALKSKLKGFKAS